MTSPKPEPMASSAKPLTAEEEASLRRDYVPRCPQTMIAHDVQKLLAALDAERAARAEAEGKLAAAYDRDPSKSVMRRVAVQCEDDVAARIAEWLRSRAGSGQFAELYHAIAEGVDRGDWRR